MTERIWATDMTDEAIEQELAELGAKWDDLMRDLEGFGGSPGEWMAERIDELEHERGKRVAASTDGEATKEG